MSTELKTKDIYAPYIRKIKSKIKSGLPLAKIYRQIDEELVKASETDNESNRPTYLNFYYFVTVNIQKIPFGKKTTHLVRSGT